MEEATTQAATTNEGEQTATETEQSATEQSTETAETTETTETAETTQQQAPEKYEFVAPEGQEFDPEFLKTYSETAKELNLTQDAAQKIIDKVSPVIAQRQMERIEAVKNEWAEQSKIDKEFGGDKLNDNLAIAKTALDQFGTPELKQLINESGIGNHPELIRFFYRAGKSISSDTFVGGHKEGGKGEPKTFNDYADKLYS